MDTKNYLGHKVNTGNEFFLERGEANTRKEENFPAAKGYQSRMQVAFFFFQVARGRGHSELVPNA